MSRIDTFLSAGKWWLAILSGLLVALSSAPFDMWYLGYVAYVPMFMAFRTESPLNQGLAYALCCTVIASNWWHSTIIYSFTFFVLIVFILCFAFFIWGYLTALSGRLFNKPAVHVFVPAVIWIGLERILSSEIIGIPCNIGISQAEQPVLIQSADLFGIYAVSFLLVLSNTILAILLTAIKEKVFPQLARRIPVLVAIALIGLNLAYGVYKTEVVYDIKKPVKIAVVQPVIETDLYLNGWRDPETRTFIKNVLSNLTAKALQDDPDIVVWPEGGNGYLNMRIDELRESLYQTALAHDVDMLISSNDLDGEGKKFNSIFSISREGSLLGRYDKVNLVPGAEDSYTAGEGFFTVPSSFGAVGPVICYESNFPSPLRKSTSNGAELLFVSTSDAAFKKTALTINHTRTAVFRAIENNRWVIHASNTGPSVIVSPGGNIVSKADMYHRGHIIGSVEYIKEQSIFTRFGYQVPILFSLLVILYMLFHLYQTRSGFGNIKKLVTVINNHISMESSEIDDRFRHWIKNTVLKNVLITGIYSVFLMLVIVSSIFTVFNRVSPSEPITNALVEFMAPLDSMVPDKITEKFLQAKKNTCGPAVLAYIFSYYGKEISETDMLRQLEVTEQGTSMLELKNAAINNNFIAIGVKESYRALMDEPLPVIAYINDNHYVVVNEISKNTVFLFDPAIGHVQVPRSVFERVWNGYLLIIRMEEIKDKSIATI